MKYTPVILQEILHSLIRKLRETPEQFVRRPGRDFTRPRTLSFETVISLLLTMSENSVYDLQNGIYTDKIVQKKHEKNENAALERVDKVV